uniref:Uncharacterized protein n=1 Tax=Physcomitrium patens TaxID=3218 RepID=A0A2K1KGB0_PHYPA|nr:hypothetical protein PHYPA_009186 [Physcomitrium patens]
MAIAVDAHVVSHGRGLYRVDASSHLETVVGTVTELEAGTITVDLLQDCYFSGSS